MSRLMEKIAYYYGPESEIADSLAESGYFDVGDTFDIDAYNKSIDDIKKHPRYKELLSKYKSYHQRSSDEDKVKSVPASILHGAALAAPIAIGIGGMMLGKKIRAKTGRSLGTKHMGKIFGGATLFTATPALYGAGTKIRNKKINKVLGSSTAFNDYLDEEHSVYKDISKHYKSKLK